MQDHSPRFTVKDVKLVEKNAAIPRGFANSLDRAWRLIGTAISFSLFGLGGLLLGLIVFPAIWLFIRDEKKRRTIARGLVCRSFWFFVQIMKTLRVIDYRISGSINAEQKGCLIVANHPSLIDVVFLIGLFRGADCVVKSAMWRNPFTALTVSSAGYIKNDSPDIVIEECIQRLKQGRNLILFPEGTRSEPSKNLNFKRGAATIAIRAAASVLPVSISCKPTTLTKGEEWYQIPRSRPLFTLDILPRISSQQYLDNADNEKAASLELTEELKKLLSPKVEIIGQSR